MPVVAPDHDKLRRHFFRTINDVPYDWRDHFYIKTYVGCVLADRERNYYDDSDFYAVVWDEEQQRVKSVEWGTTRFACIGYGYGCSVDATDEVRRKAARWYQRQLFAQWKSWNQAQAQSIQIGKKVRVVRGRNVPRGVEGIVTWIGKDRWNTTKVRIQVGDVPERSEEEKKRWPRMNNGKYVNEYVCDLPTGYLQWMLREKYDGGKLDNYVKEELSRRVGIEIYFTAITNVEVLGWEEHLETPWQGFRRAKCGRDGYSLAFANPGMVVMS